MKIRNGFVSNSSSSSFCIYGIQLGSNHIEKLKEMAVPKEKNADEEEYERCLSEDLDTYFAKNKIGLEFHSMNCADEYFYIGRSWSRIGDEETGNMLKKDVQNKIKELLGGEVKCSTISEAWRDG